MPSLHLFSPCLTSSSSPFLSTPSSLAQTRLSQPGSSSSSSSLCAFLANHPPPASSAHITCNSLQQLLIPEQAPPSDIGKFFTNTGTDVSQHIRIKDLAPPPLHEARIRVAYQGVPGAYSEAAVKRAYPLSETVPCDQFDAAFQAVEAWITDRAVLPIENSLGGSIHRNYDLLLRHRLHIVGEVQLPVKHCLLALPGVRKENVTRVISHPQALSQCENSITRVGLHDVVREEVDDTAGAAQFIAANGLRDTAAIASSRAAEIYGLNILVNNLQDDPGNITRFVMLGRQPVVPRNDIPFKTSVVFSLQEGPGALFKVLGALALRQIAVTKIESRPQRGRPLRIMEDGNKGTAKYFEYIFYLDFEASMGEAKARNAITVMKEHTRFLRVLGSYPMDMTPMQAC